MLVKENIQRLTTSSILHENNAVYLSADIICPSKLTVFFELCSRKTVRIFEQTMDDYPCIILRQVENIVYLNISQSCLIKYSCASLLFFILRVQI